MPTLGAYVRPRRLEKALAALQEQRWTIVAGGTDHFPARVDRPVEESLLDVTALPELRAISQDGRGLRIGAAVTWSAIAAAALPPACDGLRAAAREIGGPQIQNRATIGGNLCNASPAADGVPALLALDADVELASAGGLRRLPLEAFVLGNRRTALRPDELLTAVLLPAPALAGRGSFHKLGARRYLVISIVMVAGTMARSGDGTISGLRLSVGACSAAATRLRSLEESLLGRPADAAADVAVEEHLDALRPIDDVRADAAYRRHAAGVLLRRCLADLTAHPP